jgi:hypothetical protein
VEWVGETLLEPLEATVPSPLIVTWVAFVVVQDSVDDWPCSIALGLVLMVAVGAGGGGGGGGGVGAIFLWHPERARTEAKRTASEHCLRW